MAKVMLIDGNSLTYRAFFALPTDMATASGQVTNAVFGFTSMLINLMKDHQPDRIGVAFDRPEPTFRHEMTPSYKAQRESAPDILRQQMGLVREVLEALKIPSIEMIGFEADDIIATLATSGRDRGDDVIIVTGDRDSYQLVEDPHIKVLYNKRGVSDYALYDEAGIFERTGVKPVDYVQYAALRGDNSDNLPGVPGVGEKTAAKLINERGGIDGIYEVLDELTPRLRENLAANEAAVRNNIDMMVLVRDVDLPVGIDDLTRGEHDSDEVRQLFDFLEFRTLHDRLALVLGGEVRPAAEVLEAAAQLLRDEVDGARVDVRKCDVTVEEEVAAAVAHAGGTDGQLDIAVANAGSGAPGPLLLLDPDHWRFVSDLNILGTALIIKHAGLAMKERGGSLVTISSVEGFKVGKYMAPYTVTKAAVESLTRCAALELAPGVRMLEVGAGAGWPSLYMAGESGCDVMLIDLPLDGLTVAAARAARDGLAGACLALVADAAHLPFSDGSFDVINHCDVLCCLVRTREVLEIGRASCRERV